MDGPYFGTFIDTLVILTAAVVGASLAERLKLRSIIGYLAAGLLIGPAFLDLIRDVHAPQALAELGIVFLLFTVGLELPLERLRQLPRAMFMLGGLQVLVTTALLAGICMLLGLGGPASVAIGAALSLSSTAIVLRLLAERREMHSRFGRGALGILMTQDLVVGPLLVLIPALRGTPLEMAQAVGFSIIKAVVVTMLILGIGRIALRPLMNAVAATHSKEIFAALTLLIVLAAGAVTHTAGLSMAFGALLAGMLLADTAYRHQVAAEIEPFRGLLLGLFFMTVGMLLEPDLLPRHGLEILLMLAGLLAIKGIVIFIAVPAPVPDLRRLGPAWPGAGAGRRVRLRAVRACRPRATAVARAAAGADPRRRAVDDADAGAGPGRRPARAADRPPHRGGGGRPALPARRISTITSSSPAMAGSARRCRTGWRRRTFPGLRSTAIPTTSTARGARACRSITAMPAGSR